MMRHTLLATLALLGMALAWPTVHAQDNTEVPAAEVLKDRLGDPLPAGSLSRIGTLRFRSDATHQALATSPDGRWMATLTEEGIIELWDTSLGKRTQELPLADEDQAYSLHFSPDSAQLAAATDQGVARWTIPDGDPLDLLPGTDKPTRTLAFGPKSRTLATGGDDKAIVVWDLDTTEVTLTLEGHEGPISALAFDNKGKTLFSASLDGTWRQWKLRGGRESKLVKAHQGGPVFAMSLHPGGKLLATSGNDNHVRLWETRRGKAKGAMAVEEGAPTNLTFSPTGKTLAGTSPLTPVRIWDSNGRRLHNLGNVRAQAVAYNEDGGRLFAAGRGLAQWDVRSGTDLLSSLGHKGAVRALAFGPMSNKLATGGDDSSLFVWEAATGYQLLEVKSRKAIQELQFSKDGGTLAIATSTPELRLRDINQATERRLQGTGSNLTAFAMSPDGRSIATGSVDAAILFFDARTGKQTRAFFGDGGHVRALAYASRGKLLASALHQDWFGDELESAVVWNMRNGSLMFRVPCASAVLDLDFSPDGQTLATSHEDGSVQLVDVTSSKKIADFVGHTGKVHALAFSPDGLTLATAGADKTLRLWDIASGRERNALTGHAGDILDLAFSPDGQRLATASADATVLVWNIKNL